MLTLFSSVLMLLLDVPVPVGDGNTLVAPGALGRLPKVDAPEVVGQQLHRGTLFVAHEAN